MLIEPAQRGEVKALKRLGFDAYLTRPVRPASLFAQLRAEPSSEGVRASRSGIAAAPFRRDARLLPDGSRRKLKLLLAEDNDINALLARKTVERLGANVVHVRSGQEAVAAIEAAVAEGPSGRFDLVLMDIHMPDMDGIEATRAIRALGEGSADRLPIIALTANAFPEDRRQYLQAGLDDYLAKPFEREDIAAILVMWTEEPIGKVKMEGGANCA
jgi:CheY-like chemotaxis protein